jgi:hypothetical protein
MIFDSRCGSFANRMRQGALQTALAVNIGLLLSLAAGRVLAQILYQVSPSGPFALVASERCSPPPPLCSPVFSRRATPRMLSRFKRCGPNDAARSRGQTSALDVCLR